MRKRLTDDQYILLGRYVESLTNQERVFAAPRLKVAVEYLRSGAELSVAGRREFLKGTSFYHLDGPREALTDFLSFAGVRTGRRSPKCKRETEKRNALTQRGEEKVAAFMQWLTERYDYSPRTLASHRNIMKHFFLSYDKFGLMEARGFLEDREARGFAPSSINGAICVLTLYGKSVKKTIELKPRRIQKTLHLENVPTEEEYNRLLEWTREHRRYKAYWVVRLLGTTGMRCSELLQIRWKHVICGEAYLKCKGSKYRYIRFPEGVMREAAEYVEKYGKDPEGPVCANRQGEGLAAKSASGMLTYTARRTGFFPLEKAHCHAFRHFFAKMYLKQGGDVVQLAEILGHGSVDTTRLYLQKSKQEHINDINDKVRW